jgi:hypothetical protein
MSDNLSDNLLEALLKSEPEKSTQEEKISEPEKKTYISSVGGHSYDGTTMLFVDNSTSTGGTTYRENLEKLLPMFRVKFLAAFWNSDCGSPRAMSPVEIAQEFKSTGLTKPVTIVPNIDWEKPVVIITDGLINVGHMEELRKQLHGARQLPALIFVIISDNPATRNNLNIGAPFFALTSNVLCITCWQEMHELQIQYPYAKGFFQNNTNPNLADFTMPAGCPPAHVPFYHKNKWFTIDLDTLNRDINEGKLGSKELRRLDMGAFKACRQAVQTGTRDQQAQWNMFMEAADKIDVSDDLGQDLARLAKMKEELAKIPIDNVEEIRRKIKMTLDIANLEKNISARKVSIWQKFKVHSIFRSGKNVTAMDLRRDQIAKNAHTAKSSPLEELLNPHHENLIQGSCSIMQNDVNSTLMTCVLPLSQRNPLKKFLSSTVTPRTIDVIKTIVDMKIPMWIVKGQTPTVTTVREWQKIHPTARNNLVNGRLVGVGDVPVLIVPLIDVNKLDKFEPLQKMSVHNTRTEQRREDSKQQIRMLARNSFLGLFGDLEMTHSINLPKIVLTFIFLETGKESIHEHVGQLKAILRVILYQAYPNTIYLNWLKDLDKVTNLDQEKGVTLLMFAKLFGQKYQLLSVLIRMIQGWLEHRIPADMFQKLYLKFKEKTAPLESSMEEAAKLLRLFKDLKKKDPIAKKLDVSTDMIVQYPEGLSNRDEYGLDCNSTSAYFEDFKIEGTDIPALAIMHRGHLRHSTKQPGSNYRLVQKGDMVWNEVSNEMVALATKAEFGGGKYHDIRQGVEKFLSQEPLWIKCYVRKDVDEIQKERHNALKTMDDARKQLHDLKLNYESERKEKSRNAEKGTLSPLESQQHIHGLLRWTLNLPREFIDRLCDDLTHTDFVMLRKTVANMAKKLLAGKAGGYTEEDLATLRIVSSIKN